MSGHVRVANSGEHIRYRIRQHGGSSFLPAGLAHSGDLAFISQLAETNPANAIFAERGMRPAAEIATGICAGRKFRFAL